MIAKSLNRMKNGLVIADSGPIFSLALIDKLDTFLQNKRFYSVDLLNAILKAKGEEILSLKS